MNRIKTLFLAAAALTATACAHTPAFRYQDPITGFVDFATPVTAIDWQNGNALAMKSEASVPTSADLRALSHQSDAS